MWSPDIVGTLWEVSYLFGVKIWLVSQLYFREQVVCWAQSFTVSWGCFLITVNFFHLILCSINPVFLCIIKCDVFSMMPESLLTNSAVWTGVSIHRCNFWKQTDLLLCLQDVFEMLSVQFSRQHITASNYFLLLFLVASPAASALISSCREAQIVLCSSAQQLEF